jgi:hypothetical protein
MSVILTAKSSNYCQKCYAAGISRLLTGFVIVKDGGKAAVAVPPLPEPLASDVRRAARAVLGSRDPGCTARHDEHIHASTQEERNTTP